MAATDPMVGNEGTLYYCTVDDADETTTGATWSVLGYISGFSVSKNRNEKDMYNKLDKVCTKKGRKEFTGSISQLYTRYTDGVYKLFNDGIPVALKFAVDKDLTGVADETWYFSNVAFKNAKIDFGNTQENNEVTMSCDFSYTDDHCA
jgi:hypothetical protein